jgi:hypothetical protein
MRRRLIGLSLALTLAAAGPSYAVTAHHDAGATGWVAPAADNWAGHGVDPANPAACDPIDPAQCMLPFPNDWFTKPDPTSATGRRVDLDVLGMPRNVAGEPIEPAPWNRSDGFSAGAQILTMVPGMTFNADLAPSKLPSVTDMSENDDPDAGVVVLDTNTGKRWPVWAELDRYSEEDGVVPAHGVQHDLMIHPAVNFADGHHYIVALRHLVTDSHALAKPSAAFKSYRDATAPASDPRRAHMENLFRTLARAGVQRSNLYLAWDFTTASTKNVTGRLLAIRNDAFAQLGEGNPADLAAGRVVGRAPAFQVQSVTNYTPDQDANVMRQITGTFTVPCYIAPTCSPPVKCTQTGVVNDCPSPGQFVLGPSPDAVPHPVPGQTYQANFICNVGRQPAGSQQPERPVVYGHGLFGSASEVNSGPQKAMNGRFGMLYCATDWFGMATADVPNAVLAMQDLSHFPLLTDRVQQGELDFLYLARLLVHKDGFSSNAAFQWPTGQSLIDRTTAYYDGNSQGGIYGGTVCAVAVDIRRCTLGVPGMDYSVLLPRSSDFVATEPLTAKNPLTFDPTDPTSFVGYSNILDLNYPNQAQRMLVLDLIQMLWDRSDPDGFASHMTGGLPATPSHHVLLQVAYGDHQVANIQAETEARTIGAGGVYPALVPQRFGPYKDPFWGIPKIGAYPYDGSAITLFDPGPATNPTPAGPHGTDWPPTADVPNRSGDDPHSGPRNASCGQDQKNAFLQPNGLVTLPCNGPPYFAWNWNGTDGL